MKLCKIVWMLFALRSVQHVFNYFLLRDSTDRSKFSSDYWVKFNLNSINTPFLFSGTLPLSERQYDNAYQIKFAD